MFWGDVHSKQQLFAPLYRFMFAVTVLDTERVCLQMQPTEARELLLSLIASFLPYYSESITVGSCPSYW